MSMFIPRHSTKRVRSPSLFHPAPGPGTPLTPKHDTITQTTDPATAATIMRNFHTTVGQIPARKNVLKTSFSKGELGTDTT